MRDGDWKLVRPLIKGSTWTSPDEMAMDRKLEMNPETFVDILRTPEPEREIGGPLPPELYNIAADPSEEYNLADVHPERTRRMLQSLETWFEEVEAERRSIADDKL
jgi:hypothetical protein